MDAGAKLSERDVCTKFITPALVAAGWDVQTQIREEVGFTKGRIIVRGRLVTRGKAKRADYVLYYKHLPLALIEAKDQSHNEKVSYKPGKALDAIAAEGVTVLGTSRAEMDRLLDLMGGLKTEQVEIIATLFAAWNDALLDGSTPDDDWIVKEVREHWHVRKQRFTPSELMTWLGWMRQNDVIPLGHPPRTMQQTTMEF